MAKFIFQAGVFFKRPLYPANTSTVVTVYDAETGSIAPVWNDRAGADPRANPGPIWQEGQIKFYVDPGRYNIVASNGSDSKTWNDVIIVDPDAGVGTGTIEEVIAGSGLTGGGTTSTVTLNVGAGTGITVAADSVGLDTANTRNVDHSAVSIVAGTGLTGGGDLTATRTLSVSYGTTAGTAAQGNDPRLSDSREWTAATVGQAEAEAGTATTRRAWTAQRVRQAIVAWWNSIGTTVGKALLNLANPDAVRFIRINADNTVAARSASELKSDLGLGSMADETASDYIKKNTPFPIIGGGSSLAHAAYTLTRPSDSSDPYYIVVGKRGVEAGATHVIGTLYMGRSQESNHRSAGVMNVLCRNTNTGSNFSVMLQGIFNIDGFDRVHLMHNGVNYFAIKFSQLQFRQFDQFVFNGIAGDGQLFILEESQVTDVTVIPENTSTGTPLGLKGFNIPHSAISGLGTASTQTVVTGNGDTTASSIPTVDWVQTRLNEKASKDVATTSANGLMSSTDKIKLNGIAAGAEVNQNAFSIISVAGQGDVVADTKTDTLTLVGGTGVNIFTDPVTDTITFETTGTGTGTIEEVIAGNGLTGGGSTSTVTLNVGAGTGITVAADSVGLDTANTRNVDHSAVSIVAGTGLTGGGDLTATRTLNVSYGTTAGTAAQGNDSRLSDSREWTAATVGQAEAEAGTATTRRAWTAQRVRQAIVAWWNTIGTTVGKALLNLPNPGGIRFIRINADNTVTARSDSEMRTDLGLGTAATATLTTSTSDETIGRVLRVGDQDIGRRHKSIGAITNITPQWYSICTIASYSSKTTIKIYGGQFGSVGRGEYTVIAIGGENNSDETKAVAYRLTSGDPPFNAYRIVGNTLYALGGPTVSYAYIEAISSSTIVTPTLTPTTDPGGTDCKVVSAFNTDSVIPVENGGTNANNVADARTNLGLGTVATQTVVTGNGDTTASSIPTVDWVQTRLNEKASKDVATTSANGLMSSTDKIKLNGIAAGAEVNQNAFTTISVSGQSDVVADSKTDTLTLVAGTGIAITTNAATDAITIAATNAGTITNVVAGSGLTGGGTSSTVTLNVGAGDGISVAADTVAVDSTVVRTTGAQSIGGAKTFTSEVTAPSFNTTSSLKYKKDVMPFENALEKLMVIDVITYKRKIPEGEPQDDKTYLGVSAESLAKVVPELVNFKDGEPDSVNYAQGFALCVQAIQELVKKRGD